MTHANAYWEQEQLAAGETQDIHIHGAGGARRVSDHLRCRRSSGGRDGGQAGSGRRQIVARELAQIGMHPGPMAFFRS